jgi:hypothetical protein
MQDVSGPRRPSELGEPPILISYQSRIGWLAPGVLGLMTVIGLIWFAAGIAHGDFPLWFGVLWFAGLAWLWFNMVWRQARSVVVVEGTLYWTSWFRREQVPIADVARMSIRLGGTEQVIECRDGRRLRIAVAPGYRSFVDSLRGTYPDLDIAWGGYR